MTSKATELDAALELLDGLGKRASTAELMRAAEVAHISALMRDVWLASPEAAQHAGKGEAEVARLVGRRPTRRVMAALAMVGRALAQAHDEQGKLAVALWEAAASRYPCEDAPGLRGALAEAEGELASMRRVVGDMRGRLDVAAHLECEA